MRFDLAVLNGMIIDGTEGQRYLADLYIQDGLIAEIDRAKRHYAARESIDATGKIVCPGFIDTHTHSDLMLLWDRQHANALHQGVTTEILGQDGLSYAPLSAPNLEMTVKYLAGLNGRPAIRYDWSSVREFRAKFAGTVAINTAYLVPHNVLRLETTGPFDRPLRGDDLKKAKALLDQGLQDGAVGFSTGLSFCPGAYSDTTELVELCQVVAKHGAVYATHTRSVFRGEPFDPDLEAIEIAERSGCKLHFSHYRTTPETAGQVGQVMLDLDAAHQRGVDLSLELYPYPSGAGVGIIYLPPWLADGDLALQLQRLTDPNLRPRVIEGIIKSGVSLDAYFTHLRKNTAYIGRSFSAVAKERNQSVPDLLCDLLLEEELEVGFFNTPPYARPDLWEQIEQDALELLRRPYYMVGSDSILLGPNPHPRAFGTFPKLLRLCRQYAFPLEVMINRLTKVPAERFGFQKRGVLAPNWAADLVVFDPEVVRDTATYELSRSAPVGIDYVVVNGTIALRSGKVTGLFAGQALASGVQ